MSPIRLFSSISSWIFLSFVSSFVLSGVEMSTLRPSPHLVARSGCCLLFCDDGWSMYVFVAFFPCCIRDCDDSYYDVLRVHIHKSKDVLGIETLMPVCLCSLSPLFRPYCIVKTDQAAQNMAKVRHTVAVISNDSFLHCDHNQPISNSDTLLRLLPLSNVAYRIIYVATVDLFQKIHVPNS
jgi:hypothetical protein